MSRVVVDPAECVLCGRCQSVCPYGAIHVAAQVTISDACKTCLRCVTACPMGALHKIG